MVSWPISLIDFDEYAFILAAREILWGHLPYTTLFDNKPVGGSAVLALVMAVFGQTLIAIRVFGAACVLATAIILDQIVHAFSIRRIEAFGAALLYVAFSTALHGLATMLEVVLAPFTCAGVLLLARYALQSTAREHRRADAQSAWLVFASGLAFGIAIWIKTVPIVPAAVLGGAALLYALIIRGMSFARTFVHGILFAIGVILPTALTVAVYARAGELAEFAYSNYGFMRIYVNKPPLVVAAAKLVAVLVELWPLTLAAAIGLWLDLRDLFVRRRLSLLAGTSYLWLAAELVASIAPLQMFPHYFLAIIPPLAVLAARMSARCAMAIATAVNRPRAFAALILIAALVPVLPTEWANAVTVFGRPDAQRESSRIASALMPPSDRSLLVLSYEFMADYFFTGAPLPGRVAIPAHLFGPQSRLSGTDPMAELNRILANNPQIILIDDTSFGRDVSPEVREVIAAKLACCYRQAAALPEFWFIEPGNYYIRDVRIFQRSAEK